MSDTSQPDFGAMVAQAQHAALMGHGTIGGKLSAAERRAIFERELVRLMTEAKAAELAPPPVRLDQAGRHTLPGFSQKSTPAEVAEGKRMASANRLDQAGRLTPAADQLAAEAVAELSYFCETTIPDFDGGPDQ